MGGLNTLNPGKNLYDEKTKGRPKLTLAVFNNQSRKIEICTLSNLAKNIWNAEAVIDGLVNIILVNDEQLVVLNKRYLQRDYNTDVISFLISESEAKLLEGEIYISIDRVIENARTYRVDAGDELKRYVAHGLLHLLGYDDKNKREKERMTARETFYLDSTKNIFEDKI